MWNTVSCNVVYERFLRQQQDQGHLRRLQTVRGRLDTAAPKTAAFRQRKGKSLQLKEDREADIRRENNALLRKMLTIDLHPSTLHPKHIGKSGSASTLNKAARERFVQEVNASNRVRVI